MENEFPQILAAEIWDALAPITATRVFGKGERLFEKGSPPQGVHIIERGEVALIASSGRKRKCPVELAGPGTVLGLSESVCGREYKITAEACESTTVSYIERQNLLAFLRDHCDVCMQIVRLLSDDLHTLYHRVRTVQGNAARDRGKILRRVN